MFKRFRCKIPMNIQLFAEGDGAAGGHPQRGRAAALPPSGLRYDEHGNAAQGVL